jgi:hypothetical protein
MTQESRISLQEALQAQKALRDAAGLEIETFPVREFVGMISDEIEKLREQGRSDGEIAGLINANSSVRISADEISQNYADPAARQHR